MAVQFFLNILFFFETFENFCLFFRMLKFPKSSFFEDVREVIVVTLSRVELRS